MTITFPAADPDRAARYRAAGLWTTDLLDGHVAAVASRAPDRTAVVDGGHRIGYAALQSEVERVAGGLRALGVRSGDVVSSQLPNWWEAFALHLAVIRIGAVSNPLLPILRGRELRFALATAGSRVLVTAAEFRGFDHIGLALELQASLAALEHVVVVRGSGALSFDTLDGPQRHAEPGRTADDPVVMLYTSGTESDPKGAVHSHATLEHEERSVVAHFGLSGEDVVFMPSPIAHITGVLYGFHLAPVLGTTVVYQDVWEPGRGLELMARHGVTFVVAATSFLHGIVHHPERDAHELRLRAFACGGADVPPDLIRDAERTLGCLAVRVYGSTEIPTLTMGHASDPAELRATTDGRAVGVAELRIVDDDNGRPVGPGEVGNIYARGAEAFLGYLGGRSGMDGDGWIETGDRGSVDADGYLTVTGRSKDIILRGGENISAKEVEDLLYGHPDVADVAVVAVPDPRLTERACAVVVPRPGTAPTLADLSSYLDGTGTARQKYPERLELVDELPRTPTGKIQKFRLRSLVADRAAALPE